MAEIQLNAALLGFSLRPGLESLHPQAKRRRTDRSVLLESVEEKIIPDALIPNLVVTLEKRVAQQSGAIENFFITKQDLRNWCWAAVAQAITRKLDNRKIDQCVIVQRTRGLKGCCDNHKACPDPFCTSKALAKFKNLREPVVKCALSMAEIQREIPSDKTKPRRPIGCGLNDDEKGGHAITIIGWDVLNGRFRLLVGDPDGGIRNREFYDVLIDGKGREWVESYRTKRKGEP